MNFGDIIMKKKVNEKWYVSFSLYYYRVVGVSPIESSFNNISDNIRDVPHYEFIGFNFFAEIVICHHFIQYFFGNFPFFTLFQPFPVPIIGFQLFSDDCFDILIKLEKVSLK